MHFLGHRHHPSAFRIVLLISIVVDFVLGLLADIVLWELSAADYPSAANSAAIFGLVKNSLATTT